MILSRRGSTYAPNCFSNALVFGPVVIQSERSVSMAHPRQYSIKTTPDFVTLKADLTEDVRAEVLATQAAQAAQAARPASITV